MEIFIVRFYDPSNQRETNIRGFKKRKDAVAYILEQLSKKDTDYDHNYYNIDSIWID